MEKKTVITKRRKKVSLVLVLFVVFVSKLFVDHENDCHSVNHNDLCTYYRVMSMTIIKYIAVIPAGALQGEGGLQALTMPNAGSGGTIVQYTSQDGQFFVPGSY